MRRRIVALITDGFGGRGGIAAYNRSLLNAVCKFPDVDEVIALPRSVTYELDEMPANLRYRIEAAGSKLRYAQAISTVAVGLDSASLVICGHLHLLPFARLLGLRFGCSVLPIVYGIEAWRPTPHKIVNHVCRQITSFITIRKMTANLLRGWASIPNARSYYLPNCVDMKSFGVAPKRADLSAKYGIIDRTVIMTAGRMDTISFDRSKGFDEVMGTLPSLVRAVPDVVYMIMGDGDDRARLEEKARALAVADRVIFTGYVPESEKADHYRLADVVAMPGSNPDFDRYPFRFSFLEPLACGIPVVGSRLQDASERSDPDANQLVVQVDPNDPEDIKRGILAALSKRGHGIDPILSKYDYVSFEIKANAILTDIFGRR